MATSVRLPQTTPELEAKELLWWQRFADLENRFAWVQTPPLQRILRTHYVRQILATAGRGGTILDLGCGTGWLSLILASAGATSVTGVDFSPAQIKIANQNMRASGFGHRLRFECLDATADESPREQYDCVVLHGFLHHLSKDEIRNTLSSIPCLLKPQGRLVVFEPVTCRDGEPSGSQSTYRYRLEMLRRLAGSGVRWGVRRVSKEEQSLRDALAERNWGTPPFGPSPKETPFIRGELEAYLSEAFVVEEHCTVMAMSHLVVQDWLLRLESHPLSTRVLLPIVARLAAMWDRKLVAETPLPPDLWLFTLFKCRLREQS